MESEYRNLDEGELLVSSSHELRQKTREIHKLLSERNKKLRQEQRRHKNTTTQSTEHEKGFTDAISRSHPDRERQFKQLTLKPNHRSLTGNESCGIDICRKLFGIIIFQYSNDKKRLNDMTKDRKLVVQGVVEGTECFASGKINRGDMLVRINDISVNWINFTKLMMSLKKREPVRLTLQAPRIVGPRTAYTVLQVPGSDLCQAVLGKRLSHVQSQLASLQAAAMFLTLVPSEEEASNMEDVVYCFPTSEASPCLGLRGVFLTLTSALSDLVGQPACCSVLDLQDGSVHAVYKPCGKDVLVVLMPQDRISLESMKTVVNGLCSLLDMLFCDLKRAFRESERTVMDKLLAVVFHQALGLQSAVTHAGNSSSTAVGSHNLDQSFQNIPDRHLVSSMQLSPDDQLICDEILSEIESMDFDDYQDQKDLFSRRKYTICGTCLFYKAHLVTSHLSTWAQRQVSLFLSMHGLLALAARQPTDQVSCNQRKYLL